MEQDVIYAIKKRCKGLGNLQASDIERIQENVYRVRGNRNYLLKWIGRTDELGRNEIWVNQNVLGSDTINVAKLAAVIQMREGIVACWEWEAGTDLRRENRNRLSDAFTAIGRFHYRHRYDGPLQSLVTHKTYETVAALLQSESEYLCRHHEDGIFHKVRKAFSKLEVGYPTWIHGDFHPGNIRWTKDGVQIVDWAYAIRSLNLFELSYVEVMQLSDNEEWWIITPGEARRVLPAYFQAAGMSASDMYEVQQVVMLWAKLWAYDNSIKYRNEAEISKTKQQIDTILQVL